MMGKWVCVVLCLFMCNKILIRIQDFKADLIIPSFVKLS